MYEPRFKEIRNQAFSYVRKEHPRQKEHLVQNPEQMCPRGIGGRALGLVTLMQPPNPHSGAAAWRLFSRGARVKAGRITRKLLLNPGRK